MATVSAWRSIAAIQQVLARHPEVEAALRYSARALGRYHPVSDMDITVSDIDITQIGSTISAAAPGPHRCRSR